MTSTEIKMGMNENTRPSSRVLKPPGGGHTNLFGDPDAPINPPRSRRNMQNSSNLNACLGRTDLISPTMENSKPITKVQETKPETNGSDVSDSTTNVVVANNNVMAAAGSNGTHTNGATQRTGRVPPGGYSSGGFW